MRVLPAGDIRRATWLIAAQTSALILVLFAAVGGAFFLIYHHSLDSAETTQLANATATIDRPAEAPAGVWVTVLQGHTQLESADLPDELPDQAALNRVAANGGIETSTVRLHGHDFLVRTQRVGSHTTQAAIDLKQREDEEQRVVGAIAIAALLAVVLAGGASALLARRAVRPLADSLERQRRFVADASHELRTPLTHLNTRVQLLSRRGVAALGEADLEAVVTDTMVLAEILDDLLAASDTRRQPKEDAELDELVVACVEAAQPYATRLGIRLKAHTEPGPEVAIVAPALRRAITALVDNAIDHASGEVQVTLHLNRRAAIIDVTDDGPGIQPEVLPHLFERFSGQRISNAPDPSGRRHFGIGLALVADIAAAHRGAVEVINDASGRPGTTFRLTIPHSR